MLSRTDTSKGKRHDVQEIAFLCFCVGASILAPAVHAQGIARSLYTTEPELKTPEVATGIESFFEANGQLGSFEGKGGVRIAFSRFVQPDPSREKGAIVIVSGRTESMLKYKEVVYDLSRSGYSVYIHDHRGQGLSGREAAVRDEPEKGHVGNFQDYVDDLRHFVGSEVAAGQHRHLYLLAHSMGGAIAALFLEEGGPEARQFQASVLASPMLGIKGIGGFDAKTASCGFAQWQVGNGRGSDYILRGGGYNPKDFKDNEYTHSPIRYQRLRAQVDSSAAIRLGSPTHDWFANACLASDKAWRRSTQVRTPVLVMVAGSDTIVHPGGAVLFCKGLSKGSNPKGCNGPAGGPITIAGARHELLIEEDALRSQALQNIFQFFDANRR